MSDVRLTQREAQVAALVAHGSSTKAIAQRLGISENTARNYIDEIGKRLPGFGRPRHRITLFFLRIEQPPEPPQ